MGGIRGPRREALLISLAVHITSALSVVAQGSPPTAPAMEHATIAAFQQKSAEQDPSAVNAAAPSYRLEADVSMRSIPVDVRFSGARIVMFGSASRIGPPTPDAGPLEIVATVQGALSPFTVRRKSQVWGLWINTRSVDFEQAPRYYAVASTKPLEQISTPTVLAENGIGLEQSPISIALGDAAGLKPELIGEFRDAAIRLAVKRRHYVRQDTGIAFVGKALFRGQIDLPASIPVGQLDVSVFLFRGGQLIARNNSRVSLARDGIENVVYEFAQRHALLYGIFTVALAVLVGLASSFIVSLRRR